MSSHSSHAPGAPATAASTTSPTTAHQDNTPSSSTTPATTTPLPHIRIVPHLDSPRSLHFEVVDKDVPDGFVLKIGRFTDKQSLPNRVTFKSKVVSRGHAEIFTEQGKFYVRDTKSSSGTFLNHARLSPPGVESKPALLKDGDIIQLGVDYQGGTQEIYRCVKMRLELNRSWQQKANPFRLNTMKTIRTLTTADASNSTDCCICLFRIASFQSLFVAPCSHVYHYKCIRPMLIQNHPGFLCPLCRTFADLEDSVEIDDPVEEETPAEANAIAAAIEASAQDAAPATENVPSPLPAPAATPTPAVATASTSEVAPETVPAEDASSPGPALDRAATMLQEATSTENMAMQLDPAEDTAAQESPDSVAMDISPPDHQVVSSSTTAPMDISHTSNAGSTSSSGPGVPQQSPSSAFLMAPSPPAFANSFGVSSTPHPISSPANSRSSPSQQLHHVPPVSPSSSGHHMGQMIQNFVRNIAIPHRNRSRTNSSSAASPTSANGASGDVFGKTLVLTPPTTTLLSGGRHELGAVSEMDGEPGSPIEGSESGHYRSHSGHHSHMHGAGSGSGSSNQGGDDHSTSSRSSSHSRGEIMTAGAPTGAAGRSQEVAAEALV